MKQVGFKQRVKEKGVMDEQSGESKEEEVMGEGTGEPKMEELVPEWVWRTDGVDSRHQVKHDERSDQLFVE